MRAAREIVLDTLGACVIGAIAGVVLAVILSA